MNSQAIKSLLTGLLLLLGSLGSAWAQPTDRPVTYYYNDALGSPIMAADEQGNILWKAHYAPYGAKMDSPTAANSNRRWYTGHLHDEGLGLTYMGGRYYDPILGRFLGMDPVGPKPGNLHGFNRYAYAANNPYKYVDPDGELFWFAPLVIFIAKEVAGELFEQTTGIPAPTLKNAGKFVTKQVAKRVKRLAVKKGGCSFVAGTQIVTENGTANIEDVAIRDPVLAFDLNTKTQGIEQVTGLYQRIVERTYLLQIGEETLEVTANHPFWIPDWGWVEASYLQPGTRLATLDGEGVLLDGLTELSGKTIVYNIEVDRVHNYYVGDLGVLVHNCPPKTPATKGTAKPSELFGRQTRHEFTGNKIKKIKKSIKANGFDQSKPIDVIEVNGRKIIIDGHHRARAAGGAKLDRVPIRVHKVDSATAAKYEQQAAEAAHSLGRSDKW